jgi:hypothetical protein
MERDALAAQAVADGYTDAADMPEGSGPLPGEETVMAGDAPTKATYRKKGENQGKLGMLRFRWLSEKRAWPFFYPLPLSRRLFF